MELQCLMVVDGGCRLFRQEDRFAWVLVQQPIVTLSRIGRARGRDIESTEFREHQDGIHQFDITIHDVFQDQLYSYFFYNRLCDPPLLSSGH